MNDAAFSAEEKAATKSGATSGASGFVMRPRRSVTIQNGKQSLPMRSLGPEAASPTVV
jgi:hypothetical protein